MGAPLLHHHAAWLEGSASTSNGTIGAVLGQRVLTSAADSGQQWSPSDIANLVLVVFFGVAALVVAVVIYRYQKKRVSVDFSILSDINVIESPTAVESFSDRIEVS